MLFERGRRAAVIPEAAAEDQVGLGGGLLVAPLALDQVGVEVLGQLFVDQRRARLERVL
jgi:hypothetical protein